MKNTYTNFRTTTYGLFSLIFMAISGVATGQASQDFSTSITGTTVYVDGGSGAVQHILVNNVAPQTAPNAATSGSTLGYQVLFTPTRTPSIGLTDGELFGAIDVTVPNAPDNDMGTLSIDFVANPPTGGNNNVYILDDPDGLTTLRFNPVVVDATTMFSVDYIIHNTSYENSDGADDRVEIYLVNTADGTRVALLTAANAAMENRETWQRLTADLSAQAGQSMQLVVEFDTNSSSEEMAIDNVSFSSGSTMADWPMCVEPSVPTVAQFPASACPLVPFRLNIDGNLGNATEWVIYSDAEATQEIGRTSSNAFDVFAGAIPGTAYFVRGEGGCTENTVFAGLVLDVDATDCASDATPGTSFEEGLGSTNDYVDTGNPSLTHDLVNNQGQPMVNYAARGKELGVEMLYVPTRFGDGAGIGLTDGDAIGITNNADFNFPDGSQGLVLEDSDGLIASFLSPVDISGLSGVTVSFDYYINPTTYEASATGTDRIFAGIALNRADAEVIFNVSADGSGGFPGLVIGEWTTVNYTITGSYNSPIQLNLSADLDAESERIIFDNVSFSAGTIVCTDTDAPLVTCPEPVTVGAGDDCMAMVDYPAATAFDDCSSTVAITYSQESGTAFAVGVNTVTVTATDESDKSATCTFNVTVNDVTPPTITCADTITVQLDSETCTFVWQDASFDPVITDNCGVTRIINTGTNTSTLQGGTATVANDGLEIVWTATDAAGLMGTCTQVLRVINPPSCFTTSVTSQDASDFTAVSATPNPFTAGTTISFELPVNTRVGVEVLDLSGRVITTDVIASSGNNTYSWYWDAQQAALPAGMYFARLRAAGSVYTQRLVLLK